MRVEKLVLSQNSRRVIGREARDRAPLESGGMLIGSIGNRVASIHLATGPGPRAHHSASGFRRDGSYSQRLLDEAVRRSRGKWDYVGEWHSHPADVGASSRDGESMREIANDPAYERREPLLVVVVLAKGRWGLRAYQWRDGQLVELSLTVTRVVRGRPTTARVRAPARPRRSTSSSRPRTQRRRRPR